MNVAHAGTCLVFQSTPVIANGRIRHPSPLRTCYRPCFNPRPLLLTGESIGNGGHEFPFADVSIHARYC